MGLDLIYDDIYIEKVHSLNYLKPWILFCLISITLIDKIADLLYTKVIYTMGIL